MLEKANEFFLRGVAVAFVVKAVALWFIYKNEEHATVIQVLSIALLFLLCTTAVYFHNLAAEKGGLGFAKNKKWLAGFMGFFSVHAESLITKADWIQGLNDFVQLLISFVLVAYFAFFSTYNWLELRKEKARLKYDKNKQEYLDRKKLTDNRIQNDGAD